MLLYIDNLFVDSIKSIKNIPTKSLLGPGIGNQRNVISDILLLGIIMIVSLLTPKILKRVMNHMP